jgi:hypothetical protein
MCTIVQLSDPSSRLGDSVGSMAAGSEGAQATGNDVMSSSSGSLAGGGAGASRQADAGGSGDKRAADADAGAGQVCWIG